MTPGSCRSPVTELKVPLGCVFEKSCTVLVLSPLHPVAIDLEGTGVNDFAEHFGAVGVRLSQFHVDGGWIKVHVLDAVHGHYHVDRCLQEKEMY